MSNTANTLYPKLMDGLSFTNWKFRVKLLLEEKGLVHTLEDGIKKKITDEEDAKARCVIVNCLTDRNLELVKKYQIKKCFQ